MRLRRRVEVESEGGAKRAAVDDDWGSGGGGGCSRGAIAGLGLPLLLFTAAVGPIGGAVSAVITLRKPAPTFVGPLSPLARLSPRALRTEEESCGDADADGAKEAALPAASLPRERGERMESEAEWAVIESDGDGERLQLPPGEAPTGRASSEASAIFPDVCRAEAEKASSPSSWESSAFSLNSTSVPSLETYAPIPTLPPFPSLPFLPSLSLPASVKVAREAARCVAKAASSRDMERDGGIGGEAETAAEAVATGWEAGGDVECSEFGCCWVVPRAAEEEAWRCEWFDGDTDANAGGNGGRGTPPPPTRSLLLPLRWLSPTDGWDGGDSSCLRCSCHAAFVGLWSL